MTYSSAAYRIGLAAMVAVRPEVNPFDLPDPSHEARRVGYAVLRATPDLLRSSVAGHDPYPKTTLTARLLSASKYGAEREALRKTSTRFAMCEGGDWFAGRAPSDAPMFALPDGRVWDDYLVHHGRHPIRGYDAPTGATRPLDYAAGYPDEAADEAEVDEANARMRELVDRTLVAGSCGAIGGVIGWFTAVLWYWR